MATVIRMPEVLTGVTEAAIASWLVTAGQSVTIGQPLAEIETEKAVVEYASEVHGTVLELLAQEGASVAIGDPIVLVGAQDERVNATAGYAAASPAAGDEPAIPTTPHIPRVVAGPTIAAAKPSETMARGISGERRFVSPLVRRLAHERGIDLSQIAGSGPNGRIVRHDLDRHAPSLPAAQSSQAVASTDVTAPKAASHEPAAPHAATADEVPLTPMRRAIARRLVESKTTVPHFYLRADCRVDRLLDLRRDVNAASDVRVSVNDFVLAAAAAALRAVPDANATWADTMIRRHKGVDIAIAVAIDGGLVTPVLRDVDRLRVSEISRSVADLAVRARAGRLKQHELEGGAFSVSNLGMYGTQEFAAIINPPHAGILAIGAARPAPVIADGQLAVGTLMSVTLSADHRVIDGAIAAQWLSTFVERIEHPLALLA